MSDSEILRKGEQAKRLINDPLLIEIFGTLEDRYLEAWGDSSLDAPSDLRERMFLMVKALRAVRRHLDILAEDGDIKRKELEQLEEKKPRWNPFA